ncbi:MAG: hypothetical protein KBF45_15270 [Cyclobacteriaceae bacterium]|jgi:hypothetical protein|nr:hypothetical protein [Cyclobacteriaceae bacterium]
MRLLIPALVWSCLLYSCKEVTFPAPQPAGIAALKEIPAALQARYVIRDKATGEIGDTLLVESWGYHFKDKEDTDWLGQGRLSDTLIVKQYQNYYFINFKERDQWVLRLVKQNASGSLEFMSIDIQDDSRRKEILRKISRKMTVKQFDNNDYTFYQINPTPDQLMVLIKDGFFTGIELRKIK